MAPKNPLPLAEGTSDRDSFSSSPDPSALSTQHSALSTHRSPTWQRILVLLVLAGLLAGGGWWVLSRVFSKKKSPKEEDPFEAAEKALAKGRLAEARKHLAVCRQEGPDDPAVYLLLA